MSALQGSLFDTVEEVGFGSLEAIRRTALSRGAWIDVLPGWLTGADTLFERLATRVPWHAERRHMYDREVDVPRLLSFYAEGVPLPDPVLNAARSALSGYYAAELGEPFRTAGLCYYRDGRDSVAWHGDTVRKSMAEPIVAIVSLGEPRRFLLRPRGGGPSRRFDLGGGDLLVMGGTCQHTWEHTVPKVAAAGPRLSVTFRHSTA
jgi:alkylated DNA repair dioxygenase AlkB